MLIVLATSVIFLVLGLFIKMFAEKYLVVETMKDVMMQMMRAYAVCHEAKQNLRLQVNKASTKEELDSIVIRWPI